MRYVYIAGPYMGTASHDHNGHIEIERNVLQAKAAMIRLVRHGIGVFCPHTHSHGFELITPDVPPAFWYEVDMHFLRACDAVLRLPGESKGADAEVALARELGMPVFDDIDDAIWWHMTDGGQKRALL